jgi:hypothetical protein
MAGTSAEFTGKVGPHTVQRTPGSDLPSALSCIESNMRQKPPTAGWVGQYGTSGTR